MLWPHEIGTTYLLKEVLVPALDAVELVGCLLAYQLSFPLVFVLEQSGLLCHL